MILIKEEHTNSHVVVQWKWCGLILWHLHIFLTEIHPCNKEICTATLTLYFNTTANYQAGWVARRTALTFEIEIPKAQIPHFQHFTKLLYKLKIAGTCLIFLDPTPVTFRWWSTDEWNSKTLSLEICSKDVWHLQQNFLLCGWVSWTSNAFYCYQSNLKQRKHFHIQFPLID